MTTVTRMLHMKHAHFKAGRRKDFQPPALHDLLLQVKTAAPKFAQRHYPEPTGIAQGTHCAFIDNIRARRGGDGVLFDVNTYIYGLATEQFNPDFTKEKPDIKQGRIKDPQGNEREILQTYRCLAFGQTMLVEYNRGAGGMHMLELLLSYVFHEHSDDKLPSLGLMDVTTSDLDKAIKAGGGVDSVSLRLVGGSKPPADAFIANRLSELRKYMKGAKHVRVEWDSNDNVLDAKTVLEMAEEFGDENTPLDKMAIHLKDGGTIPSLEKYRERRRIEVNATRDGAVVVADIETGLCHYLDELRMVRSGWRVIDDQGNFVAPKLVSSKRT